MNKCWTCRTRTHPTSLSGFPTTSRRDSCLVVRQQVEPNIFYLGVPLSNLVWYCQRVEPEWVCSLHANADLEWLAGSYRRVPKWQSQLQFRSNSHWLPPGFLSGAINVYHPNPLLSNPAFRPPCVTFHLKDWRWPWRLQAILLPSKRCSNG